MCEPRALRRSGSPGLVRSRTRRGNTLRSGDPLTATGSEDSFIKAGEPTAVAVPPTSRVGRPSQGFLRRRARSGENKLERGAARRSRSRFLPMGWNNVERGATSSSPSTHSRPEGSRRGNNVPLGVAAGPRGTLFPPRGKSVPRAGLAASGGTFFPAGSGASTTEPEPLGSYAPPTSDPSPTRGQPEPRAPQPEPNAP